MRSVPTPRRAKTVRKQPDRYHHGDLPRAMLQEAVRTIQKDGVESLTLRGVGERLGVSRSALYRHFADKQALLRAVAGEGFRLLRSTLLEAWNSEGRGHTGFEAMGAAYVRFAVTHTSHYRVMFGGLVAGESRPSPPPPDLDAFQVLVDAIAEQQAQGLVRKDDDPRQLAQFIWAVVHGIAMLAVDGLIRSPEEAHRLFAFAYQRIRSGIDA
jgi:AcrR family transcriptional regulator